MVPHLDRRLYHQGVILDHLLHVAFRVRLANVVARVVQAGGADVARGAFQCMRVKLYRVPVSLIQGRRQLVEVWEQGPGFVLRDHHLEQCLTADVLCGLLYIQHLPDVKINHLNDVDFLAFPLGVDPR